MSQMNEFPPGWDEERVREVIDHYESQTDEEAAAEYEAYVRQKIETGIRAGEEGRVTSHEDVKRRYLP